MPCMIPTRERGSITLIKTRNKKEEHNEHSRESIRENPSQTPLDVKKALFYEKELTEEDMEGYKMVLLAKISEPVYVR